MKEFGLLSQDVLGGRRIQVVQPTPANVRELTTYHDRAFIELLLSEKGGLVGDGGEEYGLEEVCLCIRLCSK